MTPRIPDWPARARALAEELRAGGKLHSEQWRDAVQAVPRHEFVPAFYRYAEQDWQLVRGSDPAEHESWAADAYRNAPLTTQLGDTGFGNRGPTSSCSAPGLITRMLEALDPHPGHRVLEIGTGTGYNAALLCHHLGDDGVFSIDIDPDLVTTARERLHHLGYRPTLVAGDGATGLAEHSPFDRIEATCAVSHIPRAWAQQLRDGGRLITDLKLTPMTGNLVVLDRDDDRLEGHFDSGYATFMQLRSPLDPIPARTRTERDRNTATTRSTTEPLSAPWEHPSLWFLLHLREAGPLHFGYILDPDTLQLGNGFIKAADGSWCELDGHGGVTETGPRNLWTKIEDSIRWWRDNDQPGWERFGMTVTDVEQTIWLDDHAHQWSLRKTTAR